MSAQRIDAPPSTTNTLPVPSVANNSFTRELSSKHFTVTTCPQKFYVLHNFERTCHPLMGLQPVSLFQGYHLINHMLQMVLSTL